MRTFILLGAVMAALTVPALAADEAKPDAMAGYYGNTVVFTDVSGKVLRKIQYNKGGTYTEYQPSGVENGTWVINNGQDNSMMCQTIPRGTFCHDFKISAFKKAGDSWTTTEGKSTSTHTIVVGHSQ